MILCQFNALPWRSAIKMSAFQQLPVTESLSQWLLRALRHLHTCWLFVPWKWLPALEYLMNESCKAYSTLERLLCSMADYWVKQNDKPALTVWESHWRPSSPPYSNQTQLLARRIYIYRHTCCLHWTKSFQNLHRAENKLTYWEQYCNNLWKWVLLIANSLKEIITYGK